MTVQLVVGAGEVGTALYAVLARAHQVAIRDVEPVGVPADVLHIAFPWSASFVDSVKGYERQHNSDMTVVHSTVPVGTCDPEGWVHSPVRGRHPHLTEGLLAFVKHFAGERADEAAKAWEATGCDVAVHPRAAETEAAKLFELVQFGLQVVVEEEIHQWCERSGLDFDVVYTQFAESYNAGYQAMGEHQFVRPVLEHMPGPIGGHCIRQCAALLDHPLAAMVTR